MKKVMFLSMLLSAIGIAILVYVNKKDKEAQDELDAAFARAEAELRRSEEELRKIINDRKEVAKEIEKRHMWLRKELEELKAKQGIAVEGEVI